MVGLIAGGAAFLVAWAALSQPARESSVAVTQIELTPSVHAYNIVRAILADFRGFDTLGEMTVITIVFVGVWRLLARGGVREHAPDAHGRPVLLLPTSSWPSRSGQGVQPDRRRLQRRGDRRDRRIAPVPGVRQAGGAPHRPGGLAPLAVFFGLLLALLVAFVPTLSRRAGAAHMPRRPRRPC